MLCQPTSQDSLDGLRKLQIDTAARGDDCLSVLLAGLELYIRLGREVELLERMRDDAETLREAIENTPTSQQLRHLFERE